MTARTSALWLLLASTAVVSACGGGPTDDPEAADEEEVSPGADLPGAPSDSVPLRERFPTKVVYTTDPDADTVPLVRDCRARGGTFNRCGSVCPPDADLCTEVCAFTCEDIPAGDGTGPMLSLDRPRPGDTVSSPLEVSGRARGPWYFEGDFPVVLTDWDGRILAEAPASARGEWMTEDFVPFRATLTFESPYGEGDPDFMSRGTLILRKDNPSDRPELDAAVEIPVRFAPTGPASTSGADAGR